MERWPVSEAKQKDLKQRMERLSLEESDLEEEFVRGGWRRRTKN